MAVLHHSIARFDAAAPHRLLVLHGIFGQGRNWATVANVLVQLRPDWEVALADLRLHGRSREGFLPPHTLDACAGDVAALAASLGRVTAILGHSFGGKVVLSLLERADAPPSLAQAWIVDADPSSRAPAGDSWEMLDLLRSMPREWETRERFIGALVSHGLTPAVAGWMATNLERVDRTFVLALDLAGLEALLRDYFSQDLWAPVESGRIPLHLIRATGSSVIASAAADRFRAAPRARVHEVPGGHWLNVENPSGVAQQLAAELPR